MLGEQKMANLPNFRVAEAPLFKFCGVDMFGPFIIKKRKSQVKLYESILICMSCQPVHVEITDSLDTNSLILTLRRLIDTRGNEQTNFSNKCSNFIGSENELRGN